MQKCNSKPRWVTEVHDPRPLATGEAAGHFVAPWMGMIMAMK